LTAAARCDPLPEVCASCVLALVVVDSVFQESIRCASRSWARTCWPGPASTSAGGRGCLRCIPRRSRKDRTVCCPVDGPDCSDGLSVAGPCALMDRSAADTCRIPNLLLSWLLPLVRGRQGRSAGCRNFASPSRGQSAPGSLQPLAFAAASKGQVLCFHRSRVV